MTILEETSDFVGTADTKGRILYINRGGRRLSEVPDDADAQPVFDRRLPPRLGRRAGPSTKAFPTLSNRGFGAGKTALRTQGGREVPVSQVIVAHRNPEGEVTYLSTIIRDISELLAAERASREATEKLEDAHDLLAAIIRNAPSVAIQGYDRNGVITFWNPASERLYGFSEAEAVGKKLAHLILTPQEAADWEAQARRSIETGMPLPLLQWDTKNRQGRGSDRPFFDVSGRPTASRVVAHDRARVHGRRHHGPRTRGASAARLRRGPSYPGGAARPRAAAREPRAPRRRRRSRLQQPAHRDPRLRLARRAAPAARSPSSKRRSSTCAKPPERGASLVSQLLAFARRQLHKPRAIELGSLVKRLEQLLRRVLGEDLKLVVANEGELVVLADARPARAGAHQPGRQLTRRDAARRHAHDPHRALRARRRAGSLVRDPAGQLRGARRQRYRQRHERRRQAARVRALLHHQTVRRRDRARARDLLRHRAPARRRDLARQSHRPRHEFAHPPAVDESLT